MPQHGEQNTFLPTDGPRPGGTETRAPRVSIVIPTLGSPWLRRCLFSLRQNISSAISHEIVVVANGPSAAHLAAAVTLFSPPVRLLTSVANLGFGGGCNRGASETTGDLLVFLNDDIEVLPGWLETLVETADRHSDAGADGSLILFPNGSIQEAGAITWRDGSTLCLGRSFDGLMNRAFGNVESVVLASELVLRKSSLEFAAAAAEGQHALHASTLGEIRVDEILESVPAVRAAGHGPDPGLHGRML